VALVRRGIFIAIALIAVTATALGVTAAVTRTSESTGVSRVERVISGGWRSECESDSCGIQVTPIPYTTPTSAASVDLTLTITLDYKTTRGDSASAGISIDDGTPPFEQMRPRDVRLRPSTKRATTTLTFLKNDLAAAGQAYTFRFGVAPRERSGNEHAAVFGARLVVVIESWTAGD